VGKVVCVGRNYAAHAKELNNPTPESPLLFIKPATALASLLPGLHLPVGRGPVHHEVELALLIGKTLDRSGEIKPHEAITGVGIALDLTLRDVQEKLKQLGHPWEIAKAFDGACPCSGFIDIGEFSGLQDIGFRLELNGQPRQTGNSQDMLFPVNQLLQAIIGHFTLLAGDIVLTGTPAGVGPLLPGDRLLLQIDDRLQIETQVLE
jgi:2-keto-4-pentenoate hydratase/2-oxohepta-3-ene-1,7-dioic acid hydratase in catechol pathway